jgi:hypothetical protein
LHPTLAQDGAVFVPFATKNGISANVSILREHWLYHGRRHHLLHLFQVQIHIHIIRHAHTLPLIAIAVVAVAFAVHS